MDQQNEPVGSVHTGRERHRPALAAVGVRQRGGRVEAGFEPIPVLGQDEAADVAGVHAVEQGFQFVLVGGRLHQPVALRVVVPDVGHLEDIVEALDRCDAGRIGVGWRLTFAQQASADDCLGLVVVGLGDLAEPLRIALETPAVFRDAQLVEDALLEGESAKRHLGNVGPERVLLRLGVVSPESLDVQLSQPAVAPGLVDERLSCGDVVRPKVVAHGRHYKKRATRVGRPFGDCCGGQSGYLTSLTLTGVFFLADSSTASSTRWVW